MHFITERRKKLPESYEIAKNFFNLIREEVKRSDKFYGKNNSIALKQYYPYLKDKNSYFNYVQNRFAERLMHLIKNVEKDKKILDAGCGTGSEAILCGLLGGKCTGVDISEARLKIAKKRVKYYENKFNMKIEVDFYLGNLFNHVGEYDLIWVNEAISHISPLNGFLEFCYSNLKTGGKIMIADGNKINPKTYLISKKAQKRKGGVYRLTKDPLTGKKVTIAVERMLTIPTIKTLLKRNFKNIKIYFQGFFPYVVFKLLPNFCRKAEILIFGRLPVIKWLSRGYLINGIKL